MALTKRQRRVASAFADVADQMNATPKQRLALYEAGLVESNLQALNYGDRDSLGPLQQRPSQGWGSPEQVKDPAYAARKFLQAAKKVGDKGSAGQLAQAVQRSAFPARYDERASQARQIAGAVSGGGGGGGGSDSTTTTTTTESLSPAAVVAALSKQDEAARPTVSVRALPQSLTPGGYTPISTSGPSEQTNDSDLSSQLQQLMGQTTTDSKTVKRVADQQQEPGAKGEPHLKGSQIKELFWQGQGGVNIKNGEPVPQGFVSGHQDHVHVAAGPRTTREFGRIAQKKFGLHVGENPAFGGVAPVHAKNSYHYRDEAIDVSGDPKKMAAFARYVKRYAQSR